MGLNHNLTRNKANSSAGCGHAELGTNEIDQDGRTGFLIPVINEALEHLLVRKACIKAH